MENNRNYLNRSIGTITSNRFGNESEGTDERNALLRKAYEAIKIMPNNKLKDVVSDLQDKSGIKKR